MRKGQGLSMNVIIIAAIALLVLVILAVMIFNTSDSVTTGTGCAGIGGHCQSACDSAYPILNPAFKKSCGDDVCCIKISAGEN